MERSFAPCCCGGAVTADWPLGQILDRIKGNIRSNETIAQNITKHSKDMVKEALSIVPSISAEDAIALLNATSHVFVDLRDNSEQEKSGRIPGAVASSRGMMEFHIDPQSPAHKEAFNQDKTYIFYCASGGRSALAAKVAMEMGLAPVVNLTGGVSAWTKAGGPLGQTLQCG